MLAAVTNIPATVFWNLSAVAGFVLAVIARVAVETTRDPTSHNLWPFEVVITGFFGFVAACVDVGVTRASARSDSSEKGDDLRPHPLPVPLVWMASRDCSCYWRRGRRQFGTCWERI
jgi:hypothetical protein